MSVVSGTTARWFMGRSIAEVLEWRTCNAGLTHDRVADRVSVYNEAGWCLLLMPMEYTEWVIGQLWLTRHSCANGWDEVNIGQMIADRENDCGHLWGRCRPSRRWRTKVLPTVMSNIDVGSQRWRVAGWGATGWRGRSFIEKWARDLAVVE